MNRALRTALISSWLCLPAWASAQPAPTTAPAAVPAAAPAPTAPLAPAPEPTIPPEPVVAPTPAPSAPTEAALPTAPAPAPAPAPASAPATAAEPAAPAEAPEAPTEPELAPRLAVGSEGFFQPGLLLQAWLLVEHVDETTATFRLRRAEISAKGEIIPKQVAYAVMIDPAKVLEPQDGELTVEDDMGEAIGMVTVKQQPKGTALSVLQDLFITYQTEYVDTSIGQFKIPVSWEGYNSSSKLLFAERSATAREYGDKRDLGLRLAKTFEYVGYSAGFFNGTGLNNLDTNDGKDGALRLEFYPVQGLTVGGVVYASLWDRDDVGSKDRLEGDLRFERFGLVAHLEYINARDRKSGGDLHAHGVSFALAYSLLDDQLQPAVRIDYLDPNTELDVDPNTDKDKKDELVRVDAGLNWYVRKNEVKLQLDYSRFEYQDKEANNQVILASQVAF